MHLKLDNHYLEFAAQLFFHTWSMRMMVILYARGHITQTASARIYTHAIDMMRRTIGNELSVFECKKIVEEKLGSNTGHSSSHNTAATRAVYCATPNALYKALVMPTLARASAARSRMFGTSSSKTV